MTNSVIDTGIAWRCLRLLREAVRAGDAARSIRIAVQTNGMPMITQTAEDADVTFDRAGAWNSRADVPDDVARQFDLYAPLAMASRQRPLTVGHLGQSLDGRIATESGRSHYITGPENIRHLHCMRALCDAVIVGAGTVAADDPRLTTRRVAGPNPVRVVIDPDCRLPAGRTLFTDAAAPTWLVCASDADRPAGARAKTLAIDRVDGRLPADAIVAALHAEGLFGLFVEGGGITLSRFLAADALDRLQVAVAPLILGSGRPAFTLPAIDDLDDALRPACRTVPMGEDVLFDCDLRAACGPV